MKTIQQRIGKANRKLDKLTQVNREQKPCEVCGKPAQVLHHYIQKAMSAFLRHRNENHIHLCHSCHFTLHNKDPSLAALIAEKRGKKWHNWIQANRRNFVKKDKFHLEELEKKIKELL